MGQNRLHRALRQADLNGGDDLMAIVVKIYGQKLPSHSIQYPSTMGRSMSSSSHPDAGATVDARCWTASWFSPRMFSSEKVPLEVFTEEPLVPTSNAGGKEVSDIPQGRALTYGCADSEERGWGKLSTCVPCAYGDPGFITQKLHPKNL